jgi:5-methylcytosine-specific restriction endonuclease McrA
MKQRELHPCLDCGAAISGRWTRCKTCSNKARVRPAPEGMKVCGMCREPKPLADFTRCLRGAFGRGSVCRPCNTARRNEWRRRHGKAASPTDFHIDHVVALARGGPHAYSNVQIAHPFCNRAKGDGMPLGDALGLPKV